LRFSAGLEARLYVSHGWLTLQLLSEFFAPAGVASAGGEKQNNDGDVNQVGHNFIRLSVGNESWRLS
jgi:hypothetical protein